MDVSVLIMVFTSLLREGLVFGSDYFMTSNEMDRAAADTYCQDNGGTVIAFDSQAKWDDFKASDHYTVSLKNADFWIGHKYEPTICDPAGCFTIANRPWWCTTFPETCVTTDECIHVHQKDGMVHPKSCGDSKNQVVCEIATIPSTTTTSTLAATTTATVTTTTPLVTTTTLAATTTSQPVTSTSSAATTTSPPVTSGTSPPTTTSPTSATSTATGVTSTTSSVTDTSLPVTTQATASVNTMTQEELEAAVQKLRAQLTVQKNSTSLYRRQFVSTYESRISSVAIGSTAVVFLVLAFSVIVVPDMVNMIRFLYERRQDDDSFDVCMAH